MYAALEYYQKVSDRKFFHTLSYLFVFFTFLSIILQYLSAFETNFLTVFRIARLLFFKIIFASLKLNAQRGAQDNVIKSFSRVLQLNLHSLMGLKHQVVKLLKPVVYNIP
jgi:hypothetical protein